MARPRSAQAHAAVLDAAARLFAEQGIETTSMDAIADAAGVSKATIYKHWPDKLALCLEVMTYLQPSDRLPPLVPTGDTRKDIVSFLERAPRGPRNDLKARVMPHLWAYAVRTPGFSPAWRMQMIDGPRAS